MFTKAMQKVLNYTRTMEESYLKRFSHANGADIDEDMAMFMLIIALFKQLCLLYLNWQNDG